MKLTKSQWILGLSLTGTLAAVIWAGGSGDSDTDAAKPVARTDSVRAGAAAAGSTNLRKTSTGAGAEGATSDNSVGVEPARLIRALGSRKIDDPFAAHVPPAPKVIQVSAISVAPLEAAPPPPPPPPPTAPAFPWSFIGRMIDDPQHPQVFLAKNDRLTTVRVGDNIDSNWKLLGMDAKSLRVQYAPLRQVVSVNMASGTDLSTGTGKGTDPNLNLRDLSAISQPQPIEQQVTAAAPDAPTSSATPANNGVSGIEVSSMGSSSNP